MKKQILLVDDERHILRILRISLEKMGYQVMTARHGVEAFDLLTQSRPDALITDIDMPCMNGKELCYKIESEMPDRKFRIYIATSRTELEHREWSNNIRDLEFLEKPVSIRDLTLTLQNYFDTFV